MSIRYPELDTSHHVPADPAPWDILNPAEGPEGIDLTDLTELPLHRCRCATDLCVCLAPEDRLRGYARAIVGIHHTVAVIEGYYQCACGAPFCGALAHARHYLL